MSFSAQQMLTIWVAFQLAITTYGARHVSFTGIWRDVVYSHCLELTQTGSDIQSTRMSGLLGSMWTNVGGTVSNEFGIGRIRVEVASVTPAVAMAGNVREYTVNIVGDGRLSSVLLMMNPKTNKIEHEYVRDVTCFSRRGAPNAALKRRGGRPNTKLAQQIGQRRLSASATQDVDEVWRATTASSPCLARNGSVSGSFGENLLNGTRMLDYELTPINETSANVTISLAVGSLSLRLDRPQATHVDAFYEDGLPVFADGVYLKKLDSLETAMYCDLNAGTTGTIRRLVGTARMLGGFVSNRVRQVLTMKRT